MIYVKAFLASGLLCLIGQILLAGTKLGFLRTFVAAICAGVLLAAAGLMEPIVGFGLAGVIVSIVDAGEALFIGFRSTLSGNPEPLVGFGLLLLGVFAVGIVCGLTKNAPSRKQ